MQGSQPYATRRARQDVDIPGIPLLRPRRGPKNLSRRARKKVLAFPDGLWYTTKYVCDHAPNCPDLVPGETPVISGTRPPVTQSVEIL